ncbi:unnamed protein product [Gordionus sp. m RMFG-2023]|uniref:Golgi reassembly-stacking protein 2-like n=1 Tax=Gordionus sp. m RMFG-2023 TaxID=3053472 RepID=UPI0030E490E0
MGASQSLEIPGGGIEGYHVLKVQQNSPGYYAGLDAFFDFIVAVENTRLNKDDDTFKEILKANLEKPIELIVYNSKMKKVRNIEITPSTMWGGQGLLGVSIRFCSFEGANENVWHVMDVEPNSPAQRAGLISDSDYIIGADTMLYEADDFYNVIESHEGRPLKLFVYNVKCDECREVMITPDKNWGGKGSLGCGIGYGYLHRIPYQEIKRHPIDPALREKAQIRNNEVFEGNLDLSLNGNGLVLIAPESVTPTPTFDQQATPSPSNLLNNANSAVTFSNVFDKMNTTHLSANPSHMPHSSEEMSNMSHSSNSLPSSNSNVGSIHPPHIYTKDGVDNKGTVYVASVATPLNPYAQNIYARSLAQSFNKSEPSGATPLNVPAGFPPLTINAPPMFPVSTALYQQPQLFQPRPFFDNNAHYPQYQVPPTYYNGPATSNPQIPGGYNPITSHATGPSFVQGTNYPYAGINFQPDPNIPQHRPSMPPPTSQYTSY